jgi:TonB family protein
MSAAATRAPLRAVTNTRRVPRFPLSVPADITVLQSGIPYSIPGRSVSIGEHGLGLVLAGELRPGDSVGIEFRLPDAGGPFRLKAIVRYQALLHCGLEFVSLTSEQRTLIEHWTHKKSAANPRTASPVATAPSPARLLRTADAAFIGAPSRKPQSAIFRNALWIMLAGMLVLGGLGWWHWYRAWTELESQIPGSHSQPIMQSLPATVPAEVMEGRVTHKLDPIYPEAARQANIQGVVALDVIIAPDGTVADIRPISGPDELTSAAVDAVKWWRFQPYLVNGQAVQVKTTLAVDFRRD